MKADYSNNDSLLWIEKELKETNGMLRELIGMFKITTKSAIHTPPTEGM